MMSKVYSRGDRVMVMCADGKVRQGTVTGHFRNGGTTMFVVVPESSRWDGYRTEQAVRA